MKKKRFQLDDVAIEKRKQVLLSVATEFLTSSHNAS